MVAVRARVDDQAASGMGSTAGSALIVTHGQPSDPGPAAAELALLAAKVANHLPGWRVGSATLAEEGALALAIGDLGPEGVVFPLFMACGWFTGTHLPDRLRSAGGAAWRLTLPFGCSPAIQDLTVALAIAATDAPHETDLILAAHGSGRSPAPSVIAHTVAARIRREGGFRRVQAAFIDQSPRIADSTGFGQQSLCLPFFAAKGGHVTDDLPAALAEAGFQGRLLPAVGLDARVPALIAAIIRQTI
jgi:sirohydrochlorin ferrochelatase